MTGYVSRGGERLSKGTSSCTLLYTECKAVGGEGKRGECAAPRCHSVDRGGEYDSPASYGPGIMSHLFRHYLRVFLINTNTVRRRGREAGGGGSRVRRHAAPRHRRHQSKRRHRTATKLCTACFVLIATLRAPASPLPSFPLSDEGLMALELRWSGDAPSHY